MRTFIAITVLIIICVGCTPTSNQVSTQDDLAVTAPVTVENTASTDQSEKQSPPETKKFSTKQKTFLGGLGAVLFIVADIIKLIAIL